MLNIFWCRRFDTEIFITKVWYLLFIVLVQHFDYSFLPLFSVYKYIYQQLKKILIAFYSSQLKFVT